jgi:hypothetical protein
VNTLSESRAANPLSRRQLLKLAAASLLVITGCTNVRQESYLDEALNELNKLLDGMDDNEQQRVTCIVQRIRARARELADEHRIFTESFDSLLVTYDTTEAQLQQLVGDYNRRRMAKRNDLLQLQDELHAAMTPGDWAEVARVLNRAGKSLAAYTMSGG